MKKKDSKKSFSKTILVAVMMVFLVPACILIVWGKDYLFMRYHYDFSAIAQASFGSDGRIFFVDDGRKAIEILDSEGKLEKHLRGEAEKSFYYAEKVLAEGDTIYIADKVIDKKDPSHEKKRLVALRGKQQKILFEQDYNLSVRSGYHENSIMEFQVFEGNIYFLLNVDYGLELYRIEGPDDEPVLVERYYCGDKLNDASIDLTSGEVAIAVKRGYVRVFDPNEGSWNTLSVDKEHMLPNCVIMRDRKVYFSDVYDNTVYKYDMAGEGTFSTLMRLGDKPVSLDVSGDGKSILVCNADGFYTLTDKGLIRTPGADYRYFGLTLLLWAAVAVIAVSVIVLFIMAIRLLGKLLMNEHATRVIIVVMATVTVSGFVAYSLMNELYTKEENTLIDNMKLFADLVCERVDTNAILNMEDEGFYGTSSYEKLRRPLDEITQMAYLDGTYYYYDLYTIKNGKTVNILNFEDDVMCCEPYTGQDVSYIKNVVENGDSYALSIVDEEGTWIYLLLPVKNEAGEVVAVLNTGLDMSLRNRERYADIKETVLNVACTTAVVLMLIIEGVLLLAFMEKRKRTIAAKEADLPCIIPVRTLIFFTNAADSLQDAFITILCIQLYKGQLPIPDSVAVALPLSAQLLTLAVFAGFMGVVGEKKGEAKVMGAGLLVQAAGCFCCILTGSYFGVLIGKMMIGAGMGTVYVNSYAVAAKGRSEESSAKAFAEITAGSLSGVTIGSGIASVFLSIGGWRLVYLAGIFLLMLSVVIAFSTARAGRKIEILAKPADPALEESTEGKDITAFGFLFQKRIIGYFILILLPFMMSLSYREYFLPLIAEEGNVSEVTIGRFYLVCGLAFLYVGPKLTDSIIKRLGALRSSLLACGMMGLALLLYVLIPSINIVFVGVVILSLVTSFAYGCMYTFFGALPESRRFGEAKSMGVYSVFESVGSTLGPLAYGVLLSFGNRLGVGIFSGVIFVFTGFYALLMKSTRRKDAKEGS